MQSSTHSNMYSRAIKWNHVGRRSNNQGLFSWAKKKFKQRTNTHMRKKCAEFKEWEDETIMERVGARIIAINRRNQQE